MIQGHIVLDGIFDPQWKLRYGAQTHNQNLRLQTAAAMCQIKMRSFVRRRKQFCFFPNYFGQVSLRNGTTALT